jgi:hypothetical protein
MKDGCERWKGQLAEAALTETLTEGLKEHLRTCVTCAEALKGLRARKERMDALLPLVAKGAEPSADFRARVLAETEALNEGKRTQPWRIWRLAGATVVVALMLMVGVRWYERTERTVSEDELAAAQKLAEWRAPSDALLATPGQEILRTMPRLGKSYLNVPAKKDEEE